MNIIFDIGNVLIRWAPDRAVAHVFPDPADGLAYLQSVGFFDWNLIQDGGRSFADGIQALEAAHPGQTAPLADYPDRFADTIQEAIPGSWALADQLATRGHRLFALTNFARETWPAAVELYPALTTRFEDVVISGFEHMHKPNPEIYTLLLARNALAAADCLFIDDSPVNVAGAQAVGMDAVLFTDPQRLETDLMARKLL